MNNLCGLTRDDDKLLDVEEDKLSINYQIENVYKKYPEYIFLALRAKEIDDFVANKLTLLDDNLFKTPTDDSKTEYQKKIKNLIKDISNSSELLGPPFGKKLAEIKESLSVVKNVGALKNFIKLEDLFLNNEKIDSDTKEIYLYRDALIEKTHNKLSANEIIEKMHSRFPDGRLPNINKLKMALVENRIKNPERFLIKKIKDLVKKQNVERESVINDFSEPIDFYGAVRSLQFFIDYEEES